jgi:hypothetical protein
VNCLYSGLRAVAITIAIIFTVFVSSAQASECKPFPKLAIWGNYTHERVTEMVNTRLDGDWEAYLTNLDKRLAAIKGILADGKALVIKSKGKRYKFTGKQLAAYARAAEQRRDVVECLTAEMDQLQDFSTASGPEASPLVEVAAVRSGGLKMDIESQCIAGDATFTITNLGGDWPERGMVSIYRIGAGQLQKVVARRMRFSAGQQVSFKVPAKRNVTGKLGLFFDPAWTKRPFSLDAEFICL